jgi:hypothetical protein
MLRKKGPATKIAYQLNGKPLNMRGPRANKGYNRQLDREYSYFIR